VAHYCGAETQERTPSNPWRQDTRCLHKGDSTGNLEQNQLCGCRGQTLRVFECSVFGTCIERKCKNGSQPHHVCLGCDRYEA